MFGKTLGVVEYNLTFGTDTRMVNVFSCFKYKKNNNLYVIYADVATKYEIVHYGGSHIKGNVILSMSNRQDEVEIIKEFIYKVINNEDLSDFEQIDLTEATGIEIISSNNLEVKLDVIRKLEEITIPKPQVMEEEKVKEIPKEKNVGTKKKKNKNLIIILLVIIIVGGGGYFYLSTRLSSTISKKIICTKESEVSELNATLNEVNTYNFINNNALNSIDTTNTYKFNTEDDYQDFTHRGVYYKYIPTDDSTPSWDNATYTFKVTYKEVVDSAYNKPKQYEEVINYYSNKGYSCKEEIEER